MLEDTRKKSQLPILGDLDSVDMKDKIQTLLQWTKKDWDESEFKDSKFRKVCNSMRYWKNKLRPAFTRDNVIITLLNEQRNVKMDIISIVEAIEKAVPNVLVSGFSEFENPKYLCVYFRTKEERDAVYLNLKRIDDSYVVFLSWALEGSLSLLKVHWLPLAVDLDLIKKELEKYVIIVQEERQSLKLMSGRSLPAGKLSFKVKMKDAVTVDMVPHLTVIAEMDALITIQGRQPLCINCNTLGHIAKKCKYKYCYTCRKMDVKKGHVCAGVAAHSYADVARGELAVNPDGYSSEDEEEEKGVGDNTSGDDKDKTGFLSEKIEILQTQLHEQELDLKMQSRLLKKRKKERDVPIGDADIGASEAGSLGQLPEKLLIQQQSQEKDMHDMIIDKNEMLSFDGPSTLTPRAANKKNYGKTTMNLKESGQRSQSLFDAAFADSFTFSD